MPAVVDAARAVILRDGTTLPSLRTPCRLRGALSDTARQPSYIASPPLME